MSERRWAVSAQVEALASTICPQGRKSRNENATHCVLIRPPMNPSAAISVSDLCKTYRDGLLGRKKIEALQGVSLDVERGEIFGLLGPNGAGKTTLIKILLGIVRKTSGQATLLGRPAGDRQSRRKVGYLPESHRIPHHLTGNTALEYYGQLSGLSLAEIKRKRPPLLDLVGLDKWGKTSVKKYSKGMQQRLGLA
jgi:ABC-2 type transport system ATP-binding protein